MPVDQRLKRPACRLLISSLFFPCLLLAQEYSVPKDEFGYPDFNGVWNFNDSTPFERQPGFGEREFLNAEELAAKFARLAQVNSAGIVVRKRYRSAYWRSRLTTRVPTTASGLSTMSYFRIERTSIIVYPTDGRLPVTQNGVITQHSPPPSNPCNDGLVVIADRPSRISFGAISVTGRKISGSHRVACCFLSLPVRISKPIHTTITC